MKKSTQLMLAKMLGMLGSDQDGEVLSAARAIKRLLESEGLSFGDLVKLVAGSSGTQVTTYGGLADMAAMILRSDRLKVHEKRFVQSIMTQATIMPNFRLSEKQAKWFAFLFDNHGDR